MAKPENYASLPKRRVVIIDDDPAFAGVLARMVGSLGHEALVREDSSASHTYEVRDHDIVFVDLLMPKVSGVQVLEQLARQGVKSTIILMSGMTTPCAKRRSSWKNWTSVSQGCSSSRSVCPM